MTLGPGEIAAHRALSRAREAVEAMERVGLFSARKNAKAIATAIVFDVVAWAAGLPESQTMAGLDVIDTYDREVP